MHNIKFILPFRFLLLCCFSATIMASYRMGKKNLQKGVKTFISNIGETTHLDSNSLKIALTGYMEKVDSGKYAEVIPYYDSNFLSIRVVDAGQFIKMDYKQMVYFWKMQLNKQTDNSFNQRSIVTQKTTIHYLEVLGDKAYVLLTRIKDLGNGPEPMFYNLIWIVKNNRWYLFREIVHQHTIPNFH